MTRGIPNSDSHIAVNPEDSELERNVERHFSTPHISAAQYSWERRISLGADVLRKRRIYLDQKFWIFCRDAHVGNPQKPSHELIWRVLCSLVDAGRVVCPVSYPILIETLKQGNIQTRKATAHVIDRLSCGVALQPFPELVRIELHHLFAKHSEGKNAVYPLKQLVWTYPGFAVGEAIAPNPASSAEKNAVVQKCIFDAMAAETLSSIIDATADKSLLLPEDTAQHYSTLNADSASHQHEVTTFENVFLSELAGALSTIDGDIARMLRHRFEKATNQAPVPSGSPEEIRAVQTASNLIYHAFRLGKWTVDFPFLHIVAGIHAALRHRRQPYKRGDHMDHLHAHPALAYCNAFMTEKNLGNLLSKPPLKYDTAYGCRVLWAEDEVLNYLQSIEKEGSDLSA